MYLRQPIPAGTRILGYYRFSKDEQRTQSIEDQHIYCVDFLEEYDVDCSEMERLSDNGLSGVLRNRPAIDQARARVAKRSWGVIVCEDSSRLFRSVGPCMDFVGSCVDAGIRVICINDDVDTANEDWQDRLEEAQRHHGGAIRKLRHRIKRAHDGSWRRGECVGITCAGYVRIEANGAKTEHPDPRYVKNIVTAFRMMAREWPPWRIANYLTARKVPKTENAQLEAWTATNVLSMIRNPKYKGQPRFRVTVSDKKFITGKSPQVANPDPDKIKEANENHAHLKIVREFLWQRANDAIDSRDTHGARPRGKDHPLHGIPRDSRGPLSNLFDCGVCGHKMWQEGRNEGGFRCSAARQNKGRHKGVCWNRATALRALTLDRIGTAVSNAILEQDVRIADTLFGFVEHRIRTPENREVQLRELGERRKALIKERDQFTKNLMKVDVAPDFVQEEFEKLETSLTAIAAKEQELQTLMARAETLPSRTVILSAIQEQARKLLELEDAGGLLEQLVDGKIRAVPFQQFNSDKVVLRARFRLRLTNLMPLDVSTLLVDESRQAELDAMSIDLEVDLFEPSKAPKYAMAAFEFYENSGPKRPTLQRIADHLGISKRAAHLALQMGKGLKEAGRTDPFIELTEKPVNASRWR